MKYRINEERILFSQLGDEGVALDTETNEYIGFNETIFKILKGINDGNDVAEIVDSLCEEYEISEEECKAEVEEAISELQEKEYILAG